MPAKQGNHKVDLMHPKKKKKSEQQRAKVLKTSMEILKRIQFDPTMSQEQDDISIDYLDRFDGILNISMTDFFNQAEIPQHRIYFIKWRNLIIWDREKRKDLVSNGTFEDWIQNGGNPQTTTTTTTTTSSSDSSSEEEQDHDRSHQKKSKNTKISLNTRECNSEEEDESEDDDDEECQNQVIFPERKLRKIYQPYVPEDTLESWMLSRNHPEKRFVLENPTHISQRGGYYSLSHDLLPDFYQMWYTSIVSNEVFFMEEVRTDVFRLYIDIDVKLTKAEPFDMWGQGWFSLIQDFTHTFFSNLLTFDATVDTTCTVTECHSDWTDASSVTTVYKSGYRLYYPKLFVDSNIYRVFMSELGEHIHKHVQSYENQPSDWKFSEIIDVKTCDHDRNRLLGTRKFRRGTEIPRVYTYNGTYDEEGNLTKLHTKLDPQMDDTNLLQLLQCTTVRVNRECVDQYCVENETLEFSSTDKSWRSNKKKQNVCVTQSVWYASFEL